MNILVAIAQKNVQNVEAVQSRLEKRRAEIDQWVAHDHAFKLAEPELKKTRAVTDLGNRK